jgi:cytochrome P450
MTSERYFVKGEEFIPERWLEEGKDMVKEKKAFIPWGYGVHSCVGKQLALNEMRLTLARIAKDFDLEFGDGYDDRRFDEEWADYMVLSIGALPLKFIPRK